MTKQELLQNAKPILFNTEMVKAILSGNKSCTRRFIKYENNATPRATLSDFAKTVEDFECIKCCCPYQAGDILWVRETWGNGQKKGTYIYKADDEIIEVDLPEFKVSTKMLYRPSIHMPKEAARIFLRVKGVRVERLQQMQYFDCIAEGIPYHQYEKIIIQNFAKLWDSTVKKSNAEKYGWQANPWVWVIEFERAEADETH